MDNCSNEVLFHIMSYLKKSDIPSLRLVSKRFHNLAASFGQKLFKVNFKKDYDLSKFVETFEKSKSVFPFQKFGFDENVLRYFKSFDKFCIKFGKFVKLWEILYDLGSSSFELEKTLFFGNVKLLLENCANVEEMSYYILYKESGQFPTIPVLTNLRTINITFSKYTEKFESFPLLDQVLRKSPNLRNVSIEYRKCECQQPPTAVTNLLNQLNITNPTVYLQKLNLTLGVPLNNLLSADNELNTLIAISSQFKIVELSLLLIPRGVNSAETLNIFSKWIEKLTFIRKLTLGVTRCLSPDGMSDGYEDYPYPIELPIPFDSLPNLQFLKVYFLHTPAVETDTMEFPVLTSLSYRNSKMTQKLSFSGYVFPNVKSASISFNTKQERENWPLILPNVENLEIDSDTLQGIFQFSKLRKLKLRIDSQYKSRSNRRYQRRLHWNYLTGGANYISNEVICNFQLQIHETTDSFRNLPLLTELTFSGENIECWKGVIYASRTGQLGRLQRLVFSFHKFDEVRQYRKVLVKKHNIVTISTPKSSCVFDF